MATQSLSKPVEPRAKPRICCLDLDTFFVSVERLLDPSLIGKPVVVGATPGKRGVVTACSYEVRILGVRSGMPIAEAVRLAPNAVYLPTRHGEYTPYSKKVRSILERYSPTVRAASIDEYFVDFDGCERLYSKPSDVHPDQTIKRLVDEIRAVIQSELGLPASAGIGTSHTIAKIASGRAKPAGTLMVRAGQELGFLAPLPVRKFPGVGPVAEQKLKDAGLQTLGQVIRSVHAGGGRRFADLARKLQCTLDPTGDVKWRRERPAFREHDSAGVDVGSISNERTFSADVGDDQKIRDQLKSLAERVCWRARQRGIVARTVTLKLRYADFVTTTRAKTITGTNDEGEVLRCVTELYEQHHQRRMSIRLLGVCLSKLGQQERQLGLEFDGRPRPKIGHALDKVRAQYGYDAIRLGSTGGPSRWLA